jgi:acyl carrier protein
MELQEFVNLIADQFDDTPKEIFSAETKFRELEEYDSLVALSIIAMVDEEMEKKITGADIRTCESIEDLFKLAASK